MKKTLRLALVSLVAFPIPSLFLACGDSAPSEPDTVNAEQASQGASIEPDGKRRDAGADAGKKKHHHHHDAGEAGVCMVTLSGAQSGTYPCLAALAYDPSGGTSLGITPSSGSGFSFVTELTAGADPETGTYDSSNAVNAGATLTDTSGGVWREAFNFPMPTGDFSVKVESIGVEEDGSMGEEAWVNAYGTASVDAPAVPDDPYASGTVHMDIQWATFAYPDGGPDANKERDGGKKDAGEKDSGERDSGKRDAGKKDAAVECEVKMTGAIDDSEPCSSSATYVTDDAGSNTTSVSISVPSESGLPSGTIDVVISGPLKVIEYTKSTPTLISAGATLTETQAHEKAKIWVEESVDGGDKGSFTLTISSLGTKVSDGHGWVYEGAHGVYNGTLRPKGKEDAGGPLTLHIPF